MSNTVTNTVSNTATNRGMNAFFTILIGQIVSLLGSGLTSFALGVWVYQQNGSATQFALISAFALLPNVLFSPFTGTLVDRMDRRTAMIISDLGAGVSLLIIPLLIVAGHLSIWEVYVCVFLSSAFGAIRWTALQASITLLMDKKNYGRANGMLQMSNAISRIVTPFLSGFLLSAIGLNGIMFFDVGTFVFSVLTLFLVRIPSPEQTEARGSFWKETLFGWHYLKERKGLLSLLFFIALANINIGIISALITPLLLSMTSAKALGTIMSIAALGMLAGGLFMSITKGAKNKIVAITVGGFIQGLLLIIAGFTTNIPLITICATLFLFFSAIILASSNAIWQSKVAPEVQGRVFGFRTMVALACSPLAYAVAGPLAEHVFNPLLVKGGSLAGSLGSLFGVGETRGIGLLFFVIGLLTVVLVISGYLNPRMRNVEKELPDHNTVKAS